MNPRRRQRQRLKPLLYFFYRGDLHQKIHISRPSDVITAWNYPKASLEKYVYSDVRRNGQAAFSTKQVAEMINRSQKTIRRAVQEQMVRKPQFTYGLDDKRNEYAYYWSEKDIMELHTYFKSVHFGRPRKDGLVTPKPMPTASEVRAMIRQGTVFYVKVGDEFVPSWNADNIDI